MLLGHTLVVAMPAVGRARVLGELEGAGGEVGPHVRWAVLALEAVPQGQSLEGLPHLALHQLQQLLLAIL